MVRYSFLHIQKHQTEPRGHTVNRTHPQNGDDLALNERFVVILNVRGSVTHGDKHQKYGKRSGELIRHPRVLSAHILIHFIDGIIHVLRHVRYRIVEFLHGLIELGVHHAIHVLVHHLHLLVHVSREGEDSGI